MNINNEMNWALSDVKHYFWAERIVLSTENINIQYMAARMMFRKLMNIFPELDTREPRLVIQDKVIMPRLVRK